MAIVLIHFEVDDYDAWKPSFDRDPAGRAESGAAINAAAAAARRREVRFMVEG